MIGAGGLIIMWRKNTIQIFSRDTAIPKNRISEEYPGGAMENNLRILLEDIKTGHRMSEDEALHLFQIRNRDDLGDCGSCR